MPCFDMLPHVLLFFLPFIIHTYMPYAFGENGFSYHNGIPLGVLKLDGAASVANGALMLTNYDGPWSGHAFHQSEFASIFSFSTTFVFLIIPSEDTRGVSRYGLAVMLSPTVDMSKTIPGPYLGLFNIKTNGDATSGIFAVEFDTTQDPQFADIDDNHVGINVNNMVSLSSQTAGYYISNGTFSPLRLASGEPVQVWVDYDGNSHHLDVSLAPYLEHKPQRPLLSRNVNLPAVLGNSFYVGFSSSTLLSRHSTLQSRHYIIGWSFNRTWEAQPLNYSALSQVIEDVRNKAQNDSHTPMAIRLLVVILSALIIFVIVVLIYVHMKRARENGEWKIECGPPSFTYKDLVSATSNFNDRMLLGKGGFGKVYKGVLQTSRRNVAIKRVSPESKQGMKEFITEVTILGHLRHRNLVQLLGYSRHGNELLLVYDYMPNGSLDRVLHGQDRQTLDWIYRYKIIKGIASGLFYLHEDWEKVVIHRDIKTSNVLLDTEMNARLGDFGLARLHNHETDAHTTDLAGTWGYIAPELARLGRATKATDVFAFGVFMLEVACGRHPIEVNDSGEPALLTDSVLHAWEGGSVLTTVDPSLEDYISEEVDLVLKLGLLCSHPILSARPCMRLVLQYLEKDSPLPDFQPCFLNLTSRDEGFDQYILSCPSVATTMTSLSGGR